MIIKIFIFILFLIYPSGEVLRFNVYPNVSLTVNDICVGLFVFVLIMFNNLKNLPFKNNIYLFIGVCILSLLYNFERFTFTQIFISSLYILRWIIYFNLFFIFFNLKDYKFTEKLMIFSGFIFTIFGYIQYFFYNNLKNLYYLGWDDHLYRLFSTFLDPNFSGAFLVLYLFFLVGIYYSQKLIYYKKLTLYLILFTIPAIFLTYSRSSLIMLITGGFFLLWFLNKKKQIIYFILIIILFVVTSFKYSTIENMNLLRTASINARISSAKEAITIIIDNPLIGIGFNTYRYTQLKYKFRTDNIPYISHSDAGTDNSFLFILATTGIIGLISFSLLIYQIINKTYISMIKYNNIYAPIFISSFIGILVNSQFINSLFYPFIMEWLWILLALSVRQKNIKESNLI
ncbi:hypothetical protein LBMAG33_2250 [Candidatus Levyibacteriota bacterium]|nr:hypothetical protein LBMAG33_2250 [Candidatus Levybacteria bacterium]